MFGSGKLSTSGSSETPTDSTGAIFVRPWLRIRNLKSPVFGAVVEATPFVTAASRSAAGGLLDVQAAEATPVCW